MPESALIDRIMQDFPCTRKQAAQLIEQQSRKASMPAAVLPSDFKAKPMKRWECRGAVCDAHTQREALRIFRRTWRDIQLADVKRISRHGHWV